MRKYTREELRLSYDMDKEWPRGWDGRKGHRPTMSFVWVAVMGIILSLFLTSCEPAQAADGLATYYTTASCQREGTSGVWTASQEKFDEKAFTCALPHYRFGGRYIVYGHETGKSVVVRHNDMGPGKKPRKRGVIVDLTPAAFLEVCGDLKQGKCSVSVQEVK